jgi:uncharacterized RDD family membrane protein YckC
VPSDGAGLSVKIGRAGVATGRLALWPLQAVAHAGRDALTDEAERAIDGVMAGPLPEAVGRSVVKHHVLERLAAAALAAENDTSGTSPPRLDLARIEELVRRARDDPAVERMVVETIHSRLTGELVDQVVQSPAFKGALKSVLASPEVRHALERQTAGFAAELLDAGRRRAERADDSVELSVRRLLGRRPAPRPPRRYAGVGTRGTALVVDAALVALIFMIGGALIGLVASLFGTLRPAWLVAMLAVVGWLLVLVPYFVGFWSSVGQTPGMRMMRVRVVRGVDEVPSGWRSLVRLAGLALAVIPLFAGFLPALFDARRRDLPDYLAGTTVVYDDWSDGAGTGFG